VIWDWVAENVIPSEWARALGTIGALGFAAAAWVGSRRSVKRQIVNDLFKEYGDKEMGKAVANLHEQFRLHTGYKDKGPVTDKHRQKWIEFYKKQYSGDPNRVLHYHRRMVSVFYQKIALFALGDRYVTRLVKQMWADNFMVMNIVLPADTVAIAKAIGHEPHRTVEEYPEHWWLVWRFWQGPAPKRLCYRLWRLFHSAKSEPEGGLAKV
jgi:hypothetical protein